MDKTVNVVPRLVEQRDAPAAKACSGLALEAFPPDDNNAGRIAKDRAIGMMIPVIATTIDMERMFPCLSVVKDVTRPPKHTL